MWLTLAASFVYLHPSQYTLSSLKNDLSSQDVKRRCKARGCCLFLRHIASVRTDGARTSTIGKFHLRCKDLRSKELRVKSVLE
ncbi:Uncharacterized protein HZ326_2840 [Fusarium oxysporum f. sp. albedinis]|nr:Uncharacterized protein HZ326_2840 [Fusarium oxysporum f. sp. albedinis]